MKKKFELNPFQARALDDLSYCLSIASMVIPEKDIVSHLASMRQSFVKIVEFLTPKKDEASNK